VARPRAVSPGLACDEEERLVSPVMPSQTPIHDTRSETWSQAPLRADFLYPVARTTAAQRESAGRLFGEICA